MPFRNEAELRRAIAVWLQSKGEQPQQEVSVLRGRIDILTSQHVIEVKPILSYRALFQAVGQLVAVAPSGLTPVVAGFTPPKNRERSFSVAEGIRAKGFQVWFMDQDEGFLSLIGQTDSPKPESNDMVISPILEQIADLATHDEAPSETDQSLRVCIEYLRDRMAANEDRIAKLEARLSELK